MCAALDTSYWICLLLAVPAAGFLVRLFMIQHDCGHGSFFGHLANDWTGRVIGVLTLMPNDFWRRTHALHHASSGNLDRRGIGDIDTLTVREFLALPRWRQLLYRLYRHPVVMFGVGPAYLFILQHSLPMGMMERGTQPRRLFPFERVFETTEGVLNLALDLVGLAVRRQLGVTDRFAGRLLGCL
jgi:acyl-lipid omega-6 desaturase (Delta-12 desaturase)